MDILVSVGSPDCARWIEAVTLALPHARVRAWMHDDNGPADYALVWKSNAAALSPRPGLKAIFNLGTGVDTLLASLRARPAASTADVPIFRLEDVGMAVQMSDYSRYGVLNFMRRFDDYARQTSAGKWTPLVSLDRREMPMRSILRAACT